MFSIISLNASTSSKFTQHAGKVVIASIIIASVAGFFIYLISATENFLPTSPAAKYIVSGVALLFVIDAIRYTYLYYASKTKSRNSILSAKTAESSNINPGKIDLPIANRMLRKQVLSTAKYIENLHKKLQSVYTPVHPIFKGVYLGNYRAFLSIDPHFLEKHTVVESVADLADVGLRLPSDVYQKMTKGCSEMNIGLVISVTQFQPKPTVSEDDWSRFTPDLETLKVQRIQIRAHDDDAWSIIEPELEHVFSEIDKARLEERNILVHCVEGSSRSSAIIYAYLMNRCNVSLDQAFNFVLSCRPHVQIKSVMDKGLRNYHTKLQRTRPA